MKIYDFDAKFFEYVQTWVALHPGIKEKDLENHYNEMMLGWLNAPAKWLDGGTPGTYFDRYSEPKDLMKLLEEYHKRDIGVPEPLYSRIVALGSVCAEPLTRIAANTSASEALRGTAIALLRDIGTDVPRELFIDLVIRCKEPNELSEMASDILRESDESVVDELLARFDGAPAYAQKLMMDICCNFKGHEGVTERVVKLFRSRPEDRALYASLLEKLGDPDALDALYEALKLSDLGYLDYIEVRNAVESLGGDPGEERTFYGDPDYEAMRNV